MTQDSKIVPVPAEGSTPAEVARTWRQPREVSLEEVAAAIVRLSRIDEATLFGLASEGKLWTVFPYAATHERAPEPEAWNDVQEAPSRTLTDAEHEKWLPRVANALRGARKRTNGIRKSARSRPLPGRCCCGPEGWRCVREVASR